MISFRRKQTNSISNNKNNPPTTLKETVAVLKKLEIENNNLKNELKILAESSEEAGNCAVLIREYEEAKNDIELLEKNITLLQEKISQANTTSSDNIQVYRRDDLTKKQIEREEKLKTMLFNQIFKITECLDSSETIENYIELTEKILQKKFTLVREFHSLSQSYDARNCRSNFASDSSYIEYLIKELAELNGKLNACKQEYRCVELRLTDIFKTTRATLLKTQRELRGTKAQLSEENGNLKKKTLELELLHTKEKAKNEELKNAIVKLQKEKNAFEAVVELTESPRTSSGFQIGKKITRTTSLPNLKTTPLPDFSIFHHNHNPDTYTTEEEQRKELATSLQA